MSQIDVMRGTLAEYSLDSVLQVVSIGRQFVGIELHDRNRQRRGTIFVKGAQVVTADSGSATGFDAFASLFEADLETFRVFRTDAPAALPAPIGPMHKLLAEVKARAKAPSAKSVAQSPRAAAARPTPAPPAPAFQRPASVVPATPSAPPAPVSAPPPTPPVATPAPAPASRQTQESAQGLASPGAGARKVVLAVASSKGGVGKTTLALNIALSFAKQGHRTILVDGDPNGDIMSAMNARERAAVGAYDLLIDGGDPSAALMNTSVAELRILPACGEDMPDPARLNPSLRGEWQSLFRALHADAEVIVVDSPAGVYGPSLAILAAATHVLGVLQAEAIARRSFSVLTRSIEAMVTSRPEIVGVVLNMLQSREEASLEVLRASCNDFPSEWLFDITIPRHPIFLKASSLGVPLGLLDERNPPAAAWLFDGLAGELAERLQLTVQERTHRTLLL